MVNVIGMFGTCGNSKWRLPFIEKYKELGIPYFNPQLPPGQWNPACADVEAEHLAEDEIILCPITGETFALGSLAEVGFSILNAIKLDDRRDFVVLIDKELDPSIANLPGAQDSLKSRALVRQHLKKQRLKNVYLVETLEQMLEISIELYKAAKIREPFLKYNPHRVVTSVIESKK